MRQRRSHTRLWPPMRYLVGCLFLMAALSACLGDSTNDESPTATASIDPTSTTTAPVPSEPPTLTATPAQTATTEPAPIPSPTSPLLPAPVQAAVDLAADIHDVPPEAITVLSFTERQWPSTALGCPQPGQSYAQIVTPGYLVELDVTGRKLTYHTNMRTTVIDCTGR